MSDTAVKLGRRDPSSTREIGKCRTYVSLVAAVAMDPARLGLERIRGRKKKKNAGIDPKNKPKPAMFRVWPELDPERYLATLPGPRYVTGYPCRYFGNAISARNFRGKSQKITKLKSVSFLLQDEGHACVDIRTPTYGVCNHTALVPEGHKLFCKLEEKKKRGNP